LIVGRGEAIERIRRHPLYRALRVDKLIYAALEATLEAFRRETAFAEIPVLKMLAATKEEIEARTKKIAENLRRKLPENSALKIEITAGNSVIGGGSAPTVQPETVLLALEHAEMSVSRLEEILRASDPPVIARITDEKVLLDLRTVSESEESKLLEILLNLESSAP
jgi:L-seryl-tRNA(Ser) seleniumtransferase